MKLHVKVLGILMLLAAFTVTVLPAKAMGGVVNLDAQKSGSEVTVPADVDSDGVLNTVQAFYTMGKYNTVQYVNIFVDGRCVLRENLSNESVYGVVALLAYTEEKESCLQIFAYGDNDRIYFNRLYQYNKEQMKYEEMLNLQNGIYRYSQNIVRSTDQEIVIANATQPMEIGWTTWEMTYKWSNGTLKLASKQGKVTSARLKKYVTDRTITFYKEPGRSAKAFTLKKGKKVVLKQMKVGKKNLYAQFRYGKKTGWIKVGRDYDQVYKYDKNGKLLHEYFKGVQKYLAG